VLQLGSNSFFAYELFSSCAILCVFVEDLCKKAYRDARINEI